MKIMIGIAGLVGLCMATIAPALAQQGQGAAAVYDQELARLQAELARLPGAGNKERDEIEWQMIIARINARRASRQSLDRMSGTPAPQPAAMAAPSAATVAPPAAPQIAPPAAEPVVAAPSPIAPVATRLAPGAIIDPRTGIAIPPPRAQQAAPAPTAPAAPAPAVQAPATTVRTTERAEPGETAAPPQRLEIRLANGIVMTVPSDISPDALRRLTAALSSP